VVHVRDGDDGDEIAGRRSRGQREVIYASRFGFNIKLDTTR
jgi:hypothetical protein